VDKWGSQTSCIFYLTLTRCLLIIVCLAPEALASPAAESPSATTAPQGDKALAYYRDEVHQFIQQQCLGCHLPGGNAPSNGARLTLYDAADSAHEAFANFVKLPGVTPAFVLSKIIGREGHGGGVVTAEGSLLYDALQTYFSVLAGDVVTHESDSDFWADTFAEDREVTLRRASLLFAARLPDRDAIKAARQSDEKLRDHILAAMQGPSFRSFLTTAANDRLLIDGLLNGIDFGVSTFDRYPKLAELLKSLPDERPEAYEDHHDKPYLTRGDADWTFRWSITREPAELIAHVVATDRPYTEVLTADYTMVNAITDLAYRSEAGFSHEYADDSGFYDRRDFVVFRPGYNDGHIPHDEKFEVTDEQGIVSFSEYHEWPHAGVLSTQAWLARYPSTDTNRNRARARWTYFHFLGIDIEESATRTMDPVALSDTNNPTLNNRSCTVCHERLDPVAGAYQKFGNLGHYLDQYGGYDSLPESYKCPECRGGDRSDSEYQEGDTWYRDMREPGLEGETADSDLDSLQWLGRKIAGDARFAAATVRFWWPAIFGAEPLVIPQDADGPKYEQRLRAFNAQDTLIQSLAERFVDSGYDTKALFADMVMSNWYRHSLLANETALIDRDVELASVGRGRILTPEELDRKNIAVFGRTWQQWQDGTSPHGFGLETAFSGQWARYRSFYGGIDGAVVTRRNRELTPLMSNVVESMAIDLACQIVIQDFNRPRSERRLFTRLEKDTVPGDIKRATYTLPGKVNDMSKLHSHNLSLDVTLVGGPSKILLRDLTERNNESLDEQWSGAELVVRSVTLHDDSGAVWRLRGEDFATSPGFSADRWTDADGRSHWRGNEDPGVGWRLHSGAWVEVQTDAAPGNYRLEIDLGTALLENNVNDAMSAGATVRATRNIGKTESGKLAHHQVKDIMQAATHVRPGDVEAFHMWHAVMQNARQARDRGSWFGERGSHCDTWAIWPEEHLEQDAHWRRYGDPEGMMRGWTAFIHSVLTSYRYLHD